MVLELTVPTNYLIATWCVLTYLKQLGLKRCVGFLCHPVKGRIIVLHGESNTSQASPRKTIQRMCQPQEAVQP